MILTCPECATSYFVDADRLGPAGRKVRCSSCSASWRAEQEVETPLELIAPPPGAKTSFGKGAAKPGAEPLPRAFRAKVHAQRRTREAVAAGVVWAAMAAGFGLLVLTAVLFRVEVVRLWPSTAGAYAFSRMPVNPTGFAVEGVHGAPALQGGRLVLTVTGTERNVQEAARAAPALRVALLDKGGRQLVSRLVVPVALRVPSGEARPFAADFVDPPALATQVGVDFAFDVPASPTPPLRSRAPRPRAAPSPVARVAVSPISRPPSPPSLAPMSSSSLARAPVARPLPATSPYALPAAAAAFNTPAPAPRPAHG